VPISAYPPLVGINALAWTIGFFSFIVPGGLGVREGIQSFFLKFFLPLPVGIVAALLYRIWAIIGMLVFFSIFGRGLKKAVTKETGEETHADDRETGVQSGELRAHNEACEASSI
jgi:uncharacterized membrane protein YbhN (UPF0104 family)